MWFARFDCSVAGCGHGSSRGFAHRRARRRRQDEGMFRCATGANVRIVRVVLTASDATARERLTGRELGSEREVEGSARKARIPEEQSPLDTVRVATDGRAVVDMAREVVGATGWLASVSG
ncbi:hypothetical protein SAMN05428939_1322 [Streptomyces sp. TLI_105]|nr:hypothetical protein SAMN05428939_1322 [Streptomyces sp. TLI_105]